MPARPGVRGIDDVLARQSYTMAVVEPRDRTATADVSGIARGVARVPVRALARPLLVPLGLGIPLIATGVLKITYEALVYAMFMTKSVYYET